MNNVDIHCNIVLLYYVQNSNHQSIHSYIISTKKIMMDLYTPARISSGPY